ncbi:MAG TPA: TonB-dependent receptor plug domain-containing protein, partial [Candidatus Acidoferrales bacterium]
MRAPGERFRAIRAGQFTLGILLMCGLAWTARAQGTRVEGSVHDATGASVQGARVQLSASSYSAETTTDASGMFVFDGVPAVAGTVAVTADGFEPVKQSWTAAGAAPQMSFTLQPLTVNEKVVVTAARTSTPLGESPVSTIQLSRHDLQQTPNLTLDDALRQVPGFSLFRRSSSRIANPTTLGVSLRGLGSGSGPSRVLVLEDGLPLNDPFGSWIYWDRVPNESVAGVEVDEEGASSLYGS